MDVIENSLGREERYAHITRTFTILRDGLPKGQMIDLLAGMQSDREEFISEVEAFVRPLIDAGVSEAMLVAFLEAVSDLASHDTLTVLISAAAVVDEPAGRAPQ